MVDFSLQVQACLTSHPGMTLHILCRHHHGRYLLRLYLGPTCTSPCVASPLLCHVLYLGHGCVQHVVMLAGEEEEA